VLLIDSIAGIKEGDRQVLRLLRDGEIRTSVVLTKADKLGYGLSYSGEERVQQMCASIWEELRKIETKGQGRTDWTEGGERGWEREIWVTGAGDPRRGGGVGVEGARFAIARMAGLVQDERDFEGGRVVVPEQKIVPFENVVWGPVGGREKGVRASF
jgi:GTP-binding protein